MTLHSTLSNRHIGLTAMAMLAGTWAATTLSGTKTFTTASGPRVVRHDREYVRRLW